MEQNRWNTLVKAIEKFDLTDAEKAKFSGEYIRLPSGETHYEMQGEGEPVVLVHGYATPYYIYDKIFAFLLEKGYRVLRYDLLGRGFSERVKADYTPELFAKQLQELTDALIPDEKFVLIGTSMGGSVTAAYTAMHPDRVKKIFWLAPAGMEFKPPVYMKIAKQPVLGELMFRIAGGRILLKNSCAEMKYCLDQKDYYWEKFAESVRYKGMTKATLSSLRHTLLAPEKTVGYYKQVAAAGVPVCAMWGTDDHTMPYYQSEQLKSIFPDLHFYAFPNSGHIFLFDEGRRTCAILERELQEI